MSTYGTLSRPIGDYFNQAQWLVAETERFLQPGQTIKQNHHAFAALRAITEPIPVGATGWLFVLPDHSAILTTDDADLLWPHWVA